MDAEKALITRIVETRSIREVLTSKVVSSMFTDPGNRDVYDWVLARYDRYGRVPSAKLLASTFPDYELEEDVQDDFSLLVASVKEKRLYTDLQLSVKEIATSARGNPHDALEVLKRCASDLAVKFSETGTLDLSKSKESVLKDYRTLCRRKGMLGVPWPWPRMNRSTRGIQRSSYYAIYGDPGTMKTFLLVYIAAYAHKNHDQRVLFITQEMPAEDIRERWAVIRAGIDYEDFQDGRLSKKELRRLEQELDLAAEEESFIVEELDTNGKTAITTIQALAQEHHASLVCIDGLGDLSSNAEWGSWWEVNRGIKGMAKKLRVPVVGTHHTNRDKRKKPKKYDPTADEDASDIALGEALFRYADGLFHVIRTPQHKENEELSIKSKKVRKGKACWFTINARPCQDFSQKREDDAEEFVADDEDESI